MSEQRSELTPSQAKAFDTIASCWSAGNVFAVWGGAGMGKTTMLRRLHERFGGTLLGIKHFVAASRGQHPLALEETFQHVVMGALAEADAVFIDDLHLLDNVLGNLQAYFYPRRGLLLGPLTSMARRPDCIDTS